jgi:purine-cytosine permease-like protein
MHTTEQIHECVLKIKRVPWNKLFEVYFYLILTWFAVGLKYIPTFFGYKEWTDYQNFLISITSCFVISILIVVYDYYKMKYKTQEM